MEKNNSLKIIRKKVIFFNYPPPFKKKVKSIKKTKIWEISNNLKNIPQNPVPANHSFFGLFSLQKKEIKKCFSLSLAI